jgi:molecular chaperone GrpE
VSDDLYHPDHDAEDDARYGADEGFEAAQGGIDQDGDGDGFSEHGDPVANLAVAELLAKLAERTNELQSAQAELGERTADLQRLQAEYVNYRRRVERDRITVKEIAIASLLTELLPVLDDIGRAREHGELVGGFKSVAESLETVAAKMGLQQFGKEGEPFDPTIHEALMHSYAPDVTEDTCVAILQPGYRIGERTIRPARVAVAEPQPGAAPGAAKEEKSDDEESGGGEEV